MKRKMLLVLEGDKGETCLFEALLAAYGLKEDYEIETVSFRSDLTALYNRLCPDIEENDFVDLQKYVVDFPSVKNDPGKVARLKESNFNDIVLIFDFDPQNRETNDKNGKGRDKILRMMSVFSESTDNGKLYINYPMVESFFDIKFEDEEYYFCKDEISLTEVCPGKTYKEAVNERTCFRNITDYPKTEVEFTKIVKLNIRKSNSLTGLEPSPSPAGQDIILNSELALLLDSRLISVLCTCLFFIYDYAPSKLNLE